MQRIYVLSLLTSFVFVQAITAIDWNRYTNNQLLESKERSKRAGNLDLVQQIERVLSDRGIVATITLAQAPEGQEWVLKNKKMVLEQRADGPTTPPHGAGSGQWVFADPNWLYLEKASGSILNSSGSVIGKIGAIESTGGGIAPAIAQALQESAQRETRAKEQAEKLLTSERAEHATQRQELEAKIKELEKKAQQAADAGQSTTATESTAAEVKTPEEGDVPAAPSGPEIVPGPDGTPEAPEAPEAPPAPEAPSAPDAPGFGLEDTSKKIESKTTLAPLSADEMNSLQSVKQNDSDQLFIATIKKINNACAQNIDNEPYITIIKKELALLRNNPDFYKRAELDQLIEKGLQECLSMGKDDPAQPITAQSIAACLKNRCNDCLFDVTSGASLDPDLQALVDIMTTTSDELLKKTLKTCTKTFPKEITSNSYANMILDVFRELEKNKNFHKKSAHKFAIATLIKALQNIPYDPENPTLYLEDFNAAKETYFNAWITECKQCMFDTTDDADIANDIRWLISFVVAAGRGKRDIEEFINSSIARERSDLLIVNLFIESDINTATVEDTWLPALRNFLTDSQFLKPYSLMIPDSTKPPLPVMQILTAPISKIIKDPAFSFIISIGAYLSFNNDEVTKKLKESKGIINAILLKPRIQKVTTKKSIEITPETIGSSFPPHAFANKTLMQVIELLEKVKTKPNALTSALDLMKKKPRNFRRDEAAYQRRLFYRSDN